MLRYSQKEPRIGRLNFCRIRLREFDTIESLEFREIQLPELRCQRFYFKYKKGAVTQHKTWPPRAKSGNVSVLTSMM